MGQNNLVQHRRYIAASYVCMFLGLFTILFAVIAYFLARKIAMIYTKNNFYGQSTGVVIIKILELS